VFIAYLLEDIMGLISQVLRKWMPLLHYIPQLEQAGNYMLTDNTIVGAVAGNFFHISAIKLYLHLVNRRARNIE